MIQSITSGTYSYESQLQGLSSAPKTEKEKTEENASIVSSTQSPRVDTVTISEEGYKQVQMAAEAAKNTSSQNPTQNMQTAADQSAQQASQILDSAQSSSASSAKNTKNLSSYTEAQLKDMVTDGSITQIQMNIELAKRAAESAQTDTEK